MTREEEGCKTFRTKQHRALTHGTAHRIEMGLLMGLLTASSDILIVELLTMFDSLFSECIFLETTSRAMVRNCVHACMYVATFRIRRLSGFYRRSLTI